MTHPARKFIGRYRLEDVLGAGGMGVVYRATDARSGATVALKTLRVAEPWQLFGIRREIQALAKLRHPGIVRILEHGVEGDVPWYAMELVDGRPLSTGYLPPVGDSDVTAPVAAPTVRYELGRGAPATADPGAGPAGLPPAAGGALVEALSAVLRLCRPVRYLHGEGLVHRDLKPDNVLVRPAGDPVIVDFGLTERFAGTAGRETLQATGSTTGTLAYIAPEQARGDDVDARTDIYALGCILFELLTGRPPFLGHPVAVVTGHLDRKPEAPSTLAAGIPPGLDDLVLRMLAKDPRDRPGYADDVARRLAELGGIDGVGDACDDAGDGSGALAPRSYLYRPRLAGRTEELAELVGHLEEAANGRGRAVALAGEAGIGKTRLLGELARQAAARETIVIASSCERSRTTPFAAFRQVLEAARDRGAAGVAGNPWRMRLRRFAAIVPELAAGDGAAASSRWSKVELLEELWRILVALAAEAPLLVVVDDAQWCDELSRAMLAFAARAPGLASSRLLLLVAHRSSEDAQAALSTIPVHSRIALGALAPGAAASLVGDALAMADPSRLASLLHGRTAGNPLWVTEYLQASIDDGVLERADGRWQIAPGLEDVLDRELPATLGELLERRLRSLPPRPLLLLELAAVLGRSTPHALLADAAGIVDEELAADLDVLVRRQILEDGGPELAFAHDQLHEVSYALAGAARLPELHRQAALALERRGVTHAIQAQLARHWHRAGEIPKARRAYLLAGRHAHDTYAPREMERLLRCCMELEDAPTAETIAARCDVAIYVLHDRDLRAAEAEARKALAQAQELGDEELEGRVMGKLGIILLTGRRHEEARALFEGSLRKIRERNDVFAMAARAHLATIAYQEGKVEESARALEEVVALARALGDARAEAIMLGNLASMELQLGHEARGQELLERSLAMHREVGNRRSEGILLGNVGGLQVERGHWEVARSLLEQALAIHRELGNRFSEGIAMLDLGRAAEALDDPAEGRRLTDDAMPIFQEHGDRFHERIGLRRLAEMTLRSGDAAGAEALALRALAIVVSAEDAEPVRIACLLGHCNLASGRSAAPWIARARGQASARHLAEPLLVRCLEDLEAAERAFTEGRPPVAAHAADSNPPAGA